MPLAVVTRRDARSGREVVESWHHGLLAVVDPDGGVHALGDPDTAVYVRSAAKPFQAGASLEVLDEHAPEVAGALTDAELAVAWASHRGEPEQQAAAGRILARAGFAPQDLTCPAAAPKDAPGDTPSRLAFNCSGKHALFALAGAAMPGGVRGTQLLDSDGPLQRRVLAVLDDALGTAVAVAVDGCGAPAVAAPLSGLARGFQRLVAESRWARVVAAGLAHGGLVGGRGRLESALLRAGVVAKVGAEGVYGASFVAGDGGAWGVAVKAADGATRGAGVPLLRTLVALGAVADGTWSPPRPRGGGQPVGDVLASDTLTAFLADLGGGTPG